MAVLSYMNIFAVFVFFCHFACHNKKKKTLYVMAFARRLHTRIRPWASGTSTKRPGRVKEDPGEANKEMKNGEEKHACASFI